MRRLPPPSPDLRVSVVVPARNEEALVGACLEALASQEGVSPAAYEVLLVLDACTDATEARAREVAAAYPDLRLHFLDGPGKGAGHARRTGMEAACSRLLSLPAPEGLIASTDADTVVAPDWLAAQLACAARGARAIGGRIELTEEEHLPEGVSDWRREQGLLRHRNLLDNHQNRLSLEHWQFSGASLAVTAAVYEEIGGLEPRAALEDEYLERVLHQRGIHIERPLSVRVRTSARLTGRAERGLARDLALASWYRRNTLRPASINVLELKNRRNEGVSLVLPLEDWPSSGLLRELGELRESGIVDETLLVGADPDPDGLPPGVAAWAGSELMPRFGPVRGTGDALWRGVSAARSGIVVTVGAQPEGPISDLVSGLLGPLLEHDDIALVKGYQTPEDPLSELVARPLINVYRPELAGFVEPLSQNLAARRPLLEKLPFPVGPGFRLSLLLDAADRVGVEAVAQADLGLRPGTPTQSAPALGDQSYAVLAAAAARLSRGEPSNAVVPGPLFIPAGGGLDVRRVPLEERPPLESCRPPSQEKQPATGTGAP